MPIPTAPVMSTDYKRAKSATIRPKVNTIKSYMINSPHFTAFS